MFALLRTRRFGPLFVTQLLGALNDNLFKAALVVMLTVGAARDEGSVDSLVNLSSGLLILPFLLFSALAGQLADRLDKAVLIRALKIIEVAIMAIAAVGFHLGSVPLLLCALFLTGTHSAFFGPLKYGILPQQLEANELLGANALTEMGTFVAILVGTLLGGLIVALDGIGVSAISVVLIAVALSGCLSSRRIPSAPPENGSHVGVDWNLARATLSTLRLARRNRPAFRAIVGASYFWFLGALLLAQLPLIATRILGGDEHTITILLSVFTVGIGVGSVACERASRGRIELGQIAPAALLLTLLLVDLAFALGAAPREGTVPLRIALDLFALGAVGGIFIVPLYALMQERSAPGERSRIIGANNIVNAIFMVAAAGFAIALSALGLSMSSLLLCAALLTLVATIVAVVQTRDFLLRLIVSLLVRTAYRVRADGISHVPDHGAALIVANHVTYADALILGGLCRRPVRFVVYHRIYDRPELRWFFRLVRAIPIAPRSEDPARLERALVEIDRALAEGEVVGIFPEGGLTRDGELHVFRPGVETILESRPVPVVPVALGGLWGSFFSHAGGPPLRKWPRRAWSRIRVAFGSALAPADVSADVLRDHVAQLLRTVG